MNLDEFKALKVGDYVDNPMTQSRGLVTEVSTVRDGQTVRVHWGSGAPAHSVTFVYTERMQAWTHWALPPRECSVTGGPCERDDCRRGNQCFHEGVQNAS